MDSAHKINTLPFKSLAEMGDINKRDYNQFWTFLESCNDYHCDRCGESFGDVGKWGTDRVLFVDGLSGLNMMSMNMVVGSKPVKSLADWGVAMDNLERLLQKLTMDLQCHLVLVSHIERETDEVLGGIKVMASTLGRKLAPRIPRFFSDVILAEKEVSRFTWSTTALNVDLKNRFLPLSDKIPPTFGQIVDAWKSKGGVICPADTEQPAVGRPPTQVASR